MSDDILDLPELMERVQEDTDLILELFDIYTTDFVAKRKALEEAIKKNQVETLRSVAHSLKGSSGNISAKKLHGLFYKLEDMGKKGAVTGAQDILKEVDTQYEALKVRMGEIQKELK